MSITRSRVEPERSVHMTKPGSLISRSPLRTLPERLRGAGFAAGRALRSSIPVVRASVRLTVSFQLTRSDSIVMSGMYYLDFLRGLHGALAPRGYLEIGLRHGDSLALAGCPALGVDPGFDLHVELGENVTLLEETSDEFFMRTKSLKRCSRSTSTSRSSTACTCRSSRCATSSASSGCSPWTSVVVFDDILPREVDEAARDRRTRAWTGDVYKLLGILAHHRPDLICLRVDTQPTGLLLVLGLDPGSRSLNAALRRDRRAVRGAGSAAGAGGRAPSQGRRLARGRARLPRVGRAAGPARDAAARGRPHAAQGGAARPARRQPRETAATAPRIRLSTGSSGGGTARRSFARREGGPGTFVPTTIRPGS